VVAVVDLIEAAEVVEEAVEELRRVAVVDLSQE
jgi:hypothetical protein